MIEKRKDDKVVYSDGIEIEEEIQNIAKTYTEEEIPAVISDDARYLINNTFSPVRRNLLDWYPFKEDCEILEVGAGMGSLTGLLCEKARRVTSVEMSDARAQVIRERNKNRNNLTICCSDILSFDSGIQYDYVVMVGVLEYAAIFSNSETPFTDFLAKLKSLLKPDGVLLFAIENQFGLKYWLGASEEHLQKPFVGIQGYPEPKTAKTFSKAALEQMCRQIGWETRFYYLAPDYKFPTAIFTDESLPTYHDLRNPKYAYSINSCLTANERELYRDIVQNGVFPFFANAYLIEAAVVLPERHFVRIHARSEVLPAHRIMTAIDNRGEVFKIPQTKEAKQHIAQTFRNEQILIGRGVRCIPSEYDGNRLKSAFCHAPAANEVYCRALEQGDFETVRTMIDAMEKALRASSELCDGGDCHEACKALGSLQNEAVLAHGYMDMTFYNAFWVDGELVFFDQEWDFHGLPLRFILYYGLKIGYEQTLSRPQIPFSKICDHIGVSADLAKKYDELENMLWSNNFVRQGDIYGADGYYNQFNVKTFEQLMDDYHDLVHARSEYEQLREGGARIRGELICAEGECQQLRDKENQLKNEVNALLNSRSYRFGHFFARIVRFFIPRGSRRALCCRLLYTMVRHPITFMRKLSVRRVKKFFRLLKSGESEYAGRMMQNVIGDGAASLLPIVKPDIIPVDTKEKFFEDYPVLHIPQWEEPQVSIIIPVYNQFEFTYRCVESILRNTDNVTYEILIANDCSTDLTTRIEEILPGVRCMTNPENLRFLRNCNNAAKHAVGKYVLFLNNDTQVQPNWLEPLITLIESADDIGMVGSKLIYPDGKLQEAGGILWRDGSAWNYGNGQNPAQPEFNYVKQV
ncbi:MAG: glycosyltransferase, partial [Clostridia bacterium]|nr:glycosyltransferase [Clostridia bacterium]